MVRRAKAGGCHPAEEAGRLYTVINEYETDFARREPAGSLSLFKSRGARAIRRDSINPKDLFIPPAHGASDTRQRNNAVRGVE